MLSKKFLQLCHAAAEHENVLYTQIEQDKNVTAFSYYYRLCRLELVYSRKWETVAPPSVLYCRIYPSKNDPLYLHLPELIGFLGLPDYRACYFPCIESPERMEACFHALMSIVDDYIPVVEALGENGADRRLMERWATEGFFEDPKAQPQQPDTQIDWDAMLLVRSLQESILVARHTNLDAYEAFLLGDRDRAIQKYEKLQKNSLSVYEKGLLEFLRSDDSIGFVPIPPQCHAAPDYKKAEKGDITDLKGIVLLYAVFAVFFCGALAVINGVLSRDTLYFYGIEWWFGFILAALPAMFGYFLFQRRLRQLLGGSVTHLDITKEHPFLYKFLAVFWIAVLAGCLWFCVAVPAMSFRMYGHYAIYYTEEEALERFEYADVIGVYHIDIRHNVYDEPVERASCVLVLSDGRQIDLDCNGSDREQLQVVAHLFPQLKVQYVNSDRDLPDAS